MKEPQFAVGIKGSGWCPKIVANFFNHLVEVMISYDLVVLCLFSTPKSFGKVEVFKSKGRRIIHKHHIQAMGFGSEIQHGSLNEE